MNINHNSHEQGTTLIELIVAMGILSIILAAMFSLVNVSQFRVTAEQNFVPVIQEARNGVDIMIRDIHRAGYPSPSLYMATPSDPSMAPAALQSRFAVGFVGLPAQACQIAFTCTTPGGFDLVLETNPDANSAAYKEQVQWVEYRLVRPAGSATGTLMRSMVPKAPGSDPLASAQLEPMIENVLNDPTNPADAIFSYSCGAAACVTPKDIQQVQINIRVRSYNIDMQTRQYRQATITALAQKMNPAY